MTSSAEPSKSSFFGQKRVQIVLAGLAALLGLTLTLGPGILLTALLTRVLPAEFGLAVSYDRAEAGFFFRSVAIDNLRVTGRDNAPLLSAEHLGLSRLSFWGLARLIQNPKREAKSPLTLAGEITLRGLRHQGPGAELSVDFLQAREPAYLPRASAPGLLFFDKLESRGFYVAGAGAATVPEVRFSRLEARELGPEFLGGLRVEGLEAAFGKAEDRLRLDLSGLALGGLRLGGGLLRLSGRQGSLSGLLWALATCETLELARTVVHRGEREMLNINGAVFDSATAPTGAAVYTRRLDLTADLDALPGGWSIEPGLREILGTRFTLNLALELQRGERGAELKTLRFQSPGLGELALSAGLSGLAAPRSGNPADLLLAVAGARLERLSLSFADQGLMAKWYRYLDQGAFAYAPGRATADNIMTYYLEPLARELENEEGLANLPVLLSEARAFLDRPERLRLAAAPPEPQAFMSLANLDKYDIIEKLRLTVQVNDRAPVAVAARAGVFHERLPSNPRPMETLFEEDI